MIHAIPSFKSHVVNLVQYHMSGHEYGQVSIISYIYHVQSTMSM